MAHLPLVDELALIAAIGVLVTLVLARLRLPTVAGLLAAGALLGPAGFGLVRSVATIEVLAEIGVVLLLFTIGLEFSLARLGDILRQVALGGAVQVGLTILATVIAAHAFGVAFPKGLFYGFVFALSSTAIVLRALAERRELDAPHGRFIVGTLIFQDLLVVPMVLVVPLLGDSVEGGALGSVAWALGKAALVVVATVGVARSLVPRVLGWVDASRSREVFLLAILALALGTAWLTSLAGLSLALGAFLGGMVVADTEYGHRAMGDILPLRDAFVSVFFVSLGMLFDVDAVATAPLRFAVLTAGFLLAKGFLATIAALAMRFPARVAWLAGVGLAQFGEFGFVLARLAEQSGVVTDAELRPLLAAGIASMFFTPLLVRLAPHVTAGERLLAPLERLIGVRSIDEADQQGSTPTGHVVVVGFGLAGKSAARALAACGQEAIVLELDAAKVRAGRAQGLPVYYGDATSAEALGHAHLERARLLVLLMNDPAAAQRVVDTARRVAPGVPVLMRTRYLSERAGLHDLGAHDVVAEEVEGALELIARLLRRLDVPRNRIEAELGAIRRDTQTTERKLTLPRPRLGEVPGLEELAIDSVMVLAGADAVGRSAIDLDLRNRTGAMMVGLRRDGALVARASPSEPYRPGDVVYLVGTSDAIREAQALLGPPAAEAAS